MGRVVVIGAGVGGLAVGARLTALGHDVTVCEQAEAVGGKLGWVSREGFGFDTGPSLLTMPQVFTDLFAATGEPLHRELTLEPVRPVASYRFADGTSATADELTATRDWQRLLSRAERMWQATFAPFLVEPGPPSLLKLALREPAQLPVIAPHLTLRQLGRRYLRDPHLQQFLERYATYTGSDPRRAPAVLATVAYAEQTFGGWYVRGGLHRLAEALAARVSRVRTATRVTAIELAGGRVNGVRLADGGRLAADLVVADADASSVYGELLPRPRLRPRAEPSLSGFVLLLGVRGSTPDLGHHTVLFPENYDAEFDAVFGGRMPAEPTVYVSVPKDPAVAPTDCESWFVLVNAPRHGPFDWEAPGVREATSHRILELLAQRGLALRDRLVLQESITPADLERRTLTPGGAIYGSSSNGARAAFARPANRSPVPGLFLVGGSAHPGGGLPLVALSAAAVARLIGTA